MPREALAHSGQSMRILGADTAVNRPPAVAIPAAASKPRSSTNSNTPLPHGAVHAQSVHVAVALHRENRVRPIQFNKVRIVEPMAVVAEVPKSGPCAEWQCD